MRKTIGIFLLSIVLSLGLSAQQLPLKTKITGQLRDNSPAVTELTLRLPTREVNVVATAKVDSLGKFTLEFPQLEANIYKIFVADNNQFMLVLSPEEQVSVSLKAGNVGESPVVVGSVETENYLKGQYQLNEYSAKLESVNTRWKESATSPNPDSVQSILRKEYDLYTSEQKVFLKDFIQQNKFSLVGLLFIDRLDLSDDFSAYDLYDQAVFQRYPNNPFVKDIHARVEGERRLTIGKIAPDIKLPSPEGPEKSLSALKGKVVLIDFWASWCGPCRKENPHVVELYNKYHDKGFEVLGVSLDRDKDSWIKGIKDDGLVWTQISDLKYWKSDAAKLYNVTAIPFTVLVDRDGKIIGKKLRGESLSEELKKIFGF